MCRHGSSADESNVLSSMYEGKLMPKRFAYAGYELWKCTQDCKRKLNLHAQEKLCKGVNGVSSVRKNDLQHFNVTRKCNSCIVKLQLHANSKINMICILLTSIFPHLHFWHVVFAKIRSKVLQACEQWFASENNSLKNCKTD